MNILIFGSTGMLGSQILNFFCKQKHKVFATYRDDKDLKLLKIFLDRNYKKVSWIKFDILNYKKKQLKSMLKTSKAIINCIGVIKPNIKENDSESILKSIKINSIFPRDLAFLSSRKNKIYQIATDCVFDGEAGLYHENIAHNAEDVYGKTKSLGEVKSKNFYNLRCSIIGKEIKHRKSLISWFVDVKKGSKIFGFQNHLWNGITTNAYAKIVFGLVTSKIKVDNITHIIPKDIVTKYSLLKIFQKKFGRNDLIIKKINAKNKINRTLSSNFKNTNEKIWKYANYKNVPTIRELIDEIE